MFWIEIKYVHVFVHVCKFFGLIIYGFLLLVSNEELDVRDSHTLRLRCLYFCVCLKVIRYARNLLQREELPCQAWRTNFWS